MVDPKGLSAFIAGRHIALDKNPGVRPIGMGEVCKRILEQKCSFSISSQEKASFKVTDPLTMPIFTIAIVSLIRHLHSTACQVWFANDSVAAGSLKELY